MTSDDKSKSDTAGGGIIGTIYGGITKRLRDKYPELMFKYEALKKGQRRGEFPWITWERLGYYERKKRNGEMTINEIRRLEGFPPLGESVERETGSVYTVVTAGSAPEARFKDIKYRVVDDYRGHKIYLFEERMTCGDLAELKRRWQELGETVNEVPRAEARLMWGTGEHKPLGIIHATIYDEVAEAAEKSLADKVAYNTEPGFTPLELQPITDWNGAAGDIRRHFEDREKMEQAIRDKFLIPPAALAKQNALENVAHAAFSSAMGAELDKEIFAGVDLSDKPDMTAIEKNGKSWIIGENFPTHPVDALEILFPGKLDQAAMDEWRRRLDQPVPAGRIMNRLTGKAKEVANDIHRQESEKYLISARTKELFESMMKENGWTHDNCVWIPDAWHNDPHLRQSALIGRSVFDDRQLIGVFTAKERAILLAEFGGEKSDGIRIANDTTNQGE